MTKPLSPVSTLIPHKGPMRLVDEILSAQPQDSRVKSFIGENHLFLRKDGTLMPEAFAEIIAQSFAACEAQRREWAGLDTEGGGYLTAVREFEIFSKARLNDTLITKVIQKDDFMDTRIVEGEVFCGTEKLARATVYIFMWEGKNPPGVMK